MAIIIYGCGNLCFVLCHRFFYFPENKYKIIKMTTGDDSINEDYPTIAEDLVVTKYKMAAEIVNKVLKEMISECKPGCSIRELCILGDKKLTEETGKAYKKDKKLAKGRIIYASMITQQILDLLSVNC